jgi:hypothetical protein
VRVRNLDKFMGGNADEVVHILEAEKHECRLPKSTELP